MASKPELVVVVFVGDARSIYEKKLGFLKNKIEQLKKNPQYGIHIPKNLIPKYYVKRYEVNNLWKVNLQKAWRCIYTLKGTENEIFVVILDILNHKKYERRFKY